MMKPWIVLIAIVCSLAVPGFARAESVSGDASACGTALAAASQTNGFGLFQGSAACARAQRQKDANFLIVIGQIRAMTDLAILAPADDQNATKAGQLYGELFYQFGGIGFEAEYRAPADVSEFEARVRATPLALGPGYDPGWSYRSSSKTDAYASLISYQKEQRLWQIGSLALKLQNDQYFSIEQQLDALQRANPMLRVGTPAADQFAQLTSQLNAIAKTIPDLPAPPEDARLAARLNEQSPELAAQQVASGFNGPVGGKAELFRSAAEVRQSWLAKALPADQLNAMLSHTDFSTQVLVSYSFSRYTNASGKVQLAELGYHQANGGYSISANVGVVPEACGVRPAESYPFVVGVVAAVPGARIMASGMANFAAPCGPIASGQPTAP